ncbi:hypothetical protein BKA80DRAFT_65363 [Phyllosticta citrichinensis]
MGPPARRAPATAQMGKPPQYRHTFAALCTCSPRAGKLLGPTLTSFVGRARVVACLGWGISTARCSLPCARASPNMKSRVSHRIRLDANHSGRCGLDARDETVRLTTTSASPVERQSHLHFFLGRPDISSSSAAQLPSRVVPRERPFTSIVFWKKLARALALRFHFAMDTCKNAPRHRGATPASEIQRGWLVHVEGKQRMKCEANKPCRSGGAGRAVSHWASRGRRARVSLSPRSTYVGNANGVNRLNQGAWSFWPVKCQSRHGGGSSQRLSPSC